MKHFYFVIVVLLYATVLFAQEAKPEILFPDHHLCLEASGKIVLAADQAIFSFDTKSFGPTLREAVRKAKDATGDICASLVAIGIDSKSFATSSFASGKNSGAFFLTDKKDYCAMLNTVVTLRDMTKLDDAILILTDKKVENLSGVSFSLSDQSHARQQAREIALNRIVEQRETISRILGVKITDVQLIDEAPFEKLPWSDNYVYYDKGIRSGVMNSVTNYDRSGEAIDLPQQKSGFFSPEITIETQVRVVYRIGLLAEN
ncbi:MAG: hypothetical protein CVU50_06230 [Candidatus Cloacimonetes bacterium HGW-Cloacimonetes-3]|jgi:uncharacterized protein YggE|nr:MAG: hypothetical protein CVU50_06230 [Candidatus Cloacimonetes bacterium HGW-Cloacimonetes-3]